MNKLSWRHILFRSKISRVLLDSIINFAKVSKNDWFLGHIPVVSTNIAIPLKACNMPFCFLSILIYGKTMPFGKFAHTVFFLFTRAAFSVIQWQITTSKKNIISFVWLTIWICCLMFRLHCLRVTDVAPYSTTIWRAWTDSIVKCLLLIKVSCAVRNSA